MARTGPMCRIAFSTHRAGKKIMWRQTKRLRTGSLVAISTASDRFQKICKVGIVAQEPCTGPLDPGPPEVDIFWADQDEAVVDPDESLILVESRHGLYESIRHTLVGLQHAASTPSALDKYILSCDTSDRVAEFVENSSVGWDLSSVMHHLPQGEVRDQSPTDKTRLLHSLKASVAEYDVRTGMPDMADCTSLDSSQLAALHRIVTKELSIIQGPPGTGKTFTSVAALRVMLDNRNHGDPPIIVAAQTNHALDQLLLLCQGAGAEILRVGSRTKSEEMKKRTVFALRYRGKSSADREFSELERERNANTFALKELANGLFGGDILEPEQLRDAGIITHAQYDSLLDQMEWEDSTESPISMWLGDQQVLASQVKEVIFHEEELDEEAAEEYEYDLALDNLAADEENDRVQGVFIPFSQKWTGQMPVMGQWRQRCEEFLKREDDLYDGKALRGGLYLVMLSKFRDLQAARMRTLLKEATVRAKETQANKWTRDLSIVKHKRISIVGCTTTGLTKFRGFLAAMQPRTILIEEAAETREANLTSSLYPSVQQLILVGDHQQLTPHCDVLRLAEEPFNLNVSLFQRLVSMKVPYQMLNTQRRMAPELRYIVGKLYPDLKDHALVKDPLQRPLVPGMGARRSWFFTHNWPEETDADGSKANRFEAEMITKFVAYLKTNGVDMQQISVLTYYNGQRKLLLKMFRKHGIVNKAAPLKIFTVDSYQGEENDIVVLSLVRSPEPNRPPAIGFLDSQNRATVAISRARRGFFMFGNKVNLTSTRSAEARQLWGVIWNGFAEQGRVDPGRGLPLVCQHHNNEVWCTDADDFSNYAGGCHLRCGGKLPCGHDCQLTCHPTEHKDLPCTVPCPHRLSCGHKCAGQCSDVCSCTCPDFRAQQRAVRAIEASSNRVEPGNSAQPNQWQNFTRAIAQHDEQAYQDQLAARTLAVTPHDTNIRDHWTRTTTTNGRRIATVDGPLQLRPQAQPLLDLLSHETPSRPEPDAQPQVSNSRPSFAAAAAPAARLEYGFDAEVLGLVSRVAPISPSSPPSNAAPVKEDEEEEEDLIFF